MRVLQANRLSQQRDPDLAVPHFAQLPSETHWGLGQPGSSAILTPERRLASVIHFDCISPGLNWVMVSCHTAGAEDSHHQLSVVNWHNAYFAYT